MAQDSTKQVSSRTTSSAFPYAVVETSRSVGPSKAANLVFISHSSKDRKFVELLDALLKHHFIASWCTPGDLESGSTFRLEIDSALSGTKCLLVVCSQHSAASKWVTKEVVTFAERHPDRPIIPLRLDEVDIDRVCDGLSGKQAINFLESYVSGFQSLLSFFEKDFLPILERRDGDRRASDRRGSKDRRVSSTIQRLRVGFWKTYSAVRHVGEFDPMDLGRREFNKTFDALRGEAAKYRFSNADGKLFSPTEALEQAMDEVWIDFRERLEMEIRLSDPRRFGRQISSDIAYGDSNQNGLGPKAVYVIEAIAESLNERYIVTMVEDRRSEERRSADDRRNR